MTDNHTEQSSEAGESSLDKAAEEGPLPGVAEQDAAAERGEDDSETGDDVSGVDVLGGAVRNVFGHD